MYTDGMIFWARPIGRDQPYVINVTSASLAGESLISWNLTVKPTYSPMVTKIESVDDISVRLIKGVVNYSAKVSWISVAVVFNVNFGYLRQRL